MMKSRPMSIYVPPDVRPNFFGVIVKTGLVALAAISLSLVSRPVFAEEDAKKSLPVRPVVVLQTPLQVDRLERKLLVQEVVRQAFLLAAREQFRAFTRDSALMEIGDALPADAFAFQMLIDLPEEEGDCLVKLEAVQAPQKVEAWSATFQSNQEHLVLAALALADGWSQREFVDILKSAGVPKGPVPESSSSDPVGEEVPLEFLAEVRALRQIHAELLHAPESIPHLVMLAREYALLGAMTEHHWGAENKVFKARALLYAERAVRIGPEDPAAAWARALVRGLIGLPVQAQEEIARAKLLSLEIAVPAWAVPLEAYTCWDTEQLRKSVAAEVPLAAFLNVIAMELAGSSDQRIKAVNEMMRTHPECFRAAAVISREAVLGLRRTVGNAQFTQVLISVPQELQTYAGLPENLAKLVEAEFDESNPAAEIERYMSIVRQLRDIDPQVDRGEPSLPSLAFLIEELQFVHAIQILVTQRHYLAIDTTQSVNQFAGLLQQHQLFPVLGAFLNDRTQAFRAYSAAEPRLATFPLGSGAVNMVNYLSWLRTKHQGLIRARVHFQFDDVLPDLIWKLNYAFSTEERLATLRSLREMAPDCPTAISWTIRNDWKTAAPHVLEWEETTTSPLVMEALVSHYQKQLDEHPEQIPVLERCLKKWLTLERSHQVYAELAGHYQNRGMDQEWEETLMQSLELPSFGLEQARIAEQLANHAMKQEKWTKARPYAMQAAESYSAWGLLCGSRCLEALGDWELSEKLMQANSQRYDSVQLQWYLWCMRTGRGDLDAAKAFFLEETSALTSAQRSKLLDMAVFSQLEHNDTEAIEIYQNCFRQDRRNLFAGMSAVLLLDEAHRLEERDELLRQLTASEKFNAVTLLSEQLLRTGDEQEQALSPMQLELAYGYFTDSGSGTNAAWYIGKLLLNRGRREQAVVWLQRAASSPLVTLNSCTLASAELARIGVARDLQRGLEYPPETAPAARLMAKAGEVLSREQFQAAYQLNQAATEAAPHWPATWIRAGDGAYRLNDFTRAEENFTQALNLVPREPVLLVRRANAREKLGRLADAVSDLELALKISPRCLIALNNLGWIRASAEDPDLRNGNEAIRLARAAKASGDANSPRRRALMAAALAENGQFDEAVAIIQSLQQKPAIDEDRLQSWLQLYKKQQPYHRDPAAITHVHLFTIE